MPLEIKAPVFPESISEGTIATWYKKPGEAVKRDEHLVDIETDKVMLEVVAPDNGSLEKIMKEEGSTVKGEEVIALFKSGAAPAKTEEKTESKENVKEQAKETSKEESKEADKEPAKESRHGESETSSESLSPAVRRLLTEFGLDINQIKGTGKDNRITKEDIMKAVQSSQSEENTAEKLKEKSTGKQVEKPTEKTKENATAKPTEPKQALTPKTDAKERPEKRVPMTRLRARIAERLVAAKQEAAILTTFNEVNMQPIMQLRQKYKEIFEKTYGVRLGLMSFFTMAVVEALKHFPIVNASIDGNDIVYHGYYDIGIAVSSPRGLVVPVLRNAEILTMPEIEKQIAEYSQKAKNAQLTIEEITGGTFTITNGGVFGSLMATPIINPPQSGILGMHKILERPIAENGQVVIRPMMYVALSYDHRLIDGSESVRFLVTVKELLEEPARLALGI